MPNSLKCRLKKLAYQGLLSEKDLSRIYTDNDMITELDNIKREIIGVLLDYKNGYVNGEKSFNYLIDFVDTRIVKLKE